MTAELIDLPGVDELLERRRAACLLVAEQVEQLAVRVSALGQIRWDGEASMAYARSVHEEAMALRAIAGELRQG